MSARAAVTMTERLRFDCRTLVSVLSTHMSPVFADISQPYGPLIETLVRVMSWNVWCHFGPWEQRYNAIEAEIRRLQPDIAVLQESWHTQEHDPIADIGQRLRMHLARAEAWYEPFGPESGAAAAARGCFVADGGEMAGGGGGAHPW